jgi:anhydro-N-acetylmuramic acid kinase
MFAAKDRHRVIANIGGIANITDLPRAGTVRGFDTGPGNVLLDLWCARHRHTPFDVDGQWAASGTVDADLLAALLSDPYFAMPPPRAPVATTSTRAGSTGSSARHAMGRAAGPRQ